MSAMCHPIRFVIEACFFLLSVSCYYKDKGPE